jgi:hypothetical protein
MASIVGLVSGLMTIANAGFRLYKTLDQLAEGIKSAEEDITLVALDLKATTSVIGAVRECLKSSTESRSLLCRIDFKQLTTHIMTKIEATLSL